MLWLGFNDEGERVSLIDEDIFGHEANPYYRRLYEDTRTKLGGKPVEAISAGPLRLACSAEAAREQGWAEVAALWAQKTKTGAVSGAPGERGRREGERPEASRCGESRLAATQGACATGRTRASRSLLGGPRRRGGREGRPSGEEGKAPGSPRRTARRAGTARHTPQRVAQGD